MNTKYEFFKNLDKIYNECTEQDASIVIRTSNAHIESKTSSVPSLERKTFIPVHM